MLLCAWTLQCLAFLRTCQIRTLRLVRPRTPPLHLLRRRTLTISRLRRHGWALHLLRRRALHLLQRRRTLRLLRPLSSNLHLHRCRSLCSVHEALSRRILQCLRSLVV